jgi:flagellar motor switch protein FliG
MRDLLRTARPLPPEKKAGTLADEYVPSRPGAGPAAGAPSSAAEPNADSPEEDPVAALCELDPKVLAAALRDEQVLTTVLALSCLPVARAGEVLKLLPTELRRDAALRLGQAGERHADLVRIVARAVVSKGRGLAGRAEDVGADAMIKKMADVLRNLEREDRKEVLEALLTKDPEAAEKVKKLLYLFEDLLRIENRSLQGLLAEIDMKTLALALRGASEDIKEKVMGNLSARARETMNEEMNLLSAVPPASIRQAQNAVTDVMQRLDKDGKLVMLD